MKKNISIIAAIAVLFTLVSCGSDSDSTNPYKEQTKMPMYPKTLSFNSINNDGSTTREQWTFKYNSDSTIQSYTYTHSIVSGDTEISEKKDGALRYYQDFTNSRCIETKVYSTYTSKKGINKLEYSDTITEDVKFAGELISSIRTSGWRTTNGVIETISSNRTFTYANDYCTGSTYNDKENEVSYSYKWNGDNMVKATVHKQSKGSSNRGRN